jgi:putative NADPH-quinone reductase
VPRHILIINGNPDPAPERLTAALAKAYEEGARDKGHEVRRLDVGALDFSILRRAQDFATEPGEDSILEARSQIQWAHHLVFIFPLWLGSPPALLKAFLEQVGRHEFLVGPGPGGFPAGNLKTRSARLIVTMGMPTLIYRLGFGGFGVRAFARGILGLAGIRPVGITYFSVLSQARCQKWITSVRKMGERCA